MPTAPQFEWPQGEPLFETQWRAVTESLAGNGVLDNGDLALTPGTANREVAYAAGDVYYVATTYNETAGSVTVSAGDGTNDRWDTIAYDTATPGVEVKEGTPAANPEPPDVDGGEILLGVVYVPQNFDDVLASSQILNWRGRVSNEAGEVLYQDSTGVYGVNNVDAALDELQEAAQITSYPLDLDVDTDMDASGTDLTDSSAAVTIWDASAVEVPQSQLGGPASSLSAYPLAPATDLNVNAYPFALADLASPFGLPNITDMDAAGTDLTDSNVGETIWDTSAGLVPRAVVDPKLRQSTLSSATLTTSGEEIVHVDTATIAATSTVTIASADIEAGRVIRIDDLTGSAYTYPITVATEGSETIDGSSSVTINRDYGGVVLTSDGTNLSIEHQYPEREPLQEVFSGAETGNVPAGEQGVLAVTSLEPDETIEIYRAVLTTDTVEAVATGVDLELVTFNNAGSFSSRATLAAGDGATIYDDETGNPLGSYTNPGTSAVSAGVIVDNTLTTSVEIVSEAHGRTGL